MQSPVIIKTLLSRDNWEEQGKIFHWLIFPVLKLKKLPGLPLSINASIETPLTLICIIIFLKAFRRRSFYSSYKKRGSRSLIFFFRCEPTYFRTCPKLPHSWHLASLAGQVNHGWDGAHKKAFTTCGSSGDRHLWSFVVSGISWLEKEVTDEGPGELYT